MTIDQLKHAYAHHLPFTLEDPVLARTALPHRTTFYPLGFPVEVHTNSSDVLDCANESWSNYPHLFQQHPIQIRVVLSGSKALECPPAPSIRAYGHLLVSVADAQNYSVIDLQQQFACIYINSACLNNRSYFRYFFLEAAALCPISTRRATAIHAACVEQNGNGILLCGDSGAGKSTLAYACAQAGWTYITDDASFLVHGHADNLVVGNFRQVRFRPSAQALFPALKHGEVIRRAEVGKPSIELFTSTAHTLKCAPTANIRRLVFLQRKRIRRPQLVPFPQEIARHFILQTNAWLPEVQAHRSDHVDALLRLPPLELRYRELPWAIEQLTNLVQ